MNQTIHSVKSLKSSSSYPTLKRYPTYHILPYPTLHTPPYLTSPLLSLPKPTPRIHPPTLPYHTPSIPYPILLFLYPTIPFPTTNPSVLPHATLPTISYPTLPTTPHPSPPTHPTPSHPTLFTLPYHTQPRPTLPYLICLQTLSFLFFSFLRYTI